MTRRIHFLIILLLSFAFGVCGNVGAQENKKSLQALFNSANELYRQQKYEEALNDYREILNSGYENGVLYYNLGNTYAKLGKKGYALLNYERAKKFIPHNQDLNFNSKYLRSQLNLPTNESSYNIFRRLMNSHVNFYTYTQMIVIIIVLIFLTAGIHVFSLFKQWPAKRFIRILSVTVVVFGVFLYGAYLKYQQYNFGIIVNKTESYFEPSVDATVHFTVPEGSKVSFEQSIDGWVKIKRFDGKLGWVADENFEKI